MRIEERFDNDERMIINGLIESENVSKFTMGRMLKKIDLQISLIAGEMADEMKAIYKGLRTKISALTEDEWVMLKDATPLFCLDVEEPYSEGDEITEAEE